MSIGSVAVIDIGSNTIKLLVATRAADGGVLPLASAARDARISRGISAVSPRLTAEGMAAGLVAIRELVQAAEPYSPGQMLLVATSAVRDAANGAGFCEQVRAATGHDVRILTGEEEAALIGRGLTMDPALRDHRDFYVFDLGGGSLECLAFRERAMEQAVSLPLGCVRLTERFVDEPAGAFPATAAAAIAGHTRELLATRFRFSLPSPAVAVGTGGTVATVRGILGARQARRFEETSPTVSIEELRTLRREIGERPLSARRQVPGLPPARADVFPTALATLITVAEAGGIDAYQHSLYNLRYGLADAALPLVSS